MTASALVRSRPTAPPTAVPAAPAATAPRTGAALNQAVRKYAQEDRGKSWRLLIESLVILVGALALTWLIPASMWPLKLLVGALSGLTFMRPFIVYHDHLHGAMFHDSKAAAAILSVVGLYMMAPRSIWRATHNYHHKHNAKLSSVSIGTLPVVNVEAWQKMSGFERWSYRAQRHPLVIFPAYITFFMFGLSLLPFLWKSPASGRRHPSGLLAVLLHFGLIAAVVAISGWLDAFAVVILPLAVVHGVGSYLFYAQHNFPSMDLHGEGGPEYTDAALKASSLFVMPRFMHWITGNIGFHHVHHLNHRIPFYRLPEAMAEVPELQNPGTTTWSPKDVVANLSLAVWSDEQGRMLTWRELRRLDTKAA